MKICWSRVSGKKETTYFNALNPQSHKRPKHSGLESKNTNTTWRAKTWGPIFKIGMIWPLSHQTQCYTNTQYYLRFWNAQKSQDEVHSKMNNIHVSFDWFLKWVKDAINTKANYPHRTITGRAISPLVLDKYNKIAINSPR